MPEILNFPKILPNLGTWPFFTFFHHTVNVVNIAITEMLTTPSQHCLCTRPLLPEMGMLPH